MRGLRADGVIGLAMKGRTLGEGVEFKLFRKVIWERAHAWV
jgi:hypothetical protein